MSERELVAELADLRSRLAHEQAQAPAELRRRHLTEIDIRGAAFGFSESRSDRHAAWLRRIAEIEAALPLLEYPGPPSAA